MLKKRIIACLDIKDGRTVKGTQFGALRDAGDPVELAKYYSENLIDELVFLDISASSEKRSTVTELVESVSKNINIPFTVGGGIRTLEDAIAIIEAGADKVAINSHAYINPDLLGEIAAVFGSQAVVAAVDSKRVKGEDKVFIYGGKKNTLLSTHDWVSRLEDLGAGEILLSSIDADGLKNGFDLELTRMVSESVGIPVIASGGAGTAQDFVDVFQKGNADAALAASLFHYDNMNISKLKSFLNQKNISVRCN